mgnify:CR=1 FL=1
MKIVKYILTLLTLPFLVIALIYAMLRVLFTLTIEFALETGNDFYYDWIERINGLFKKL